MSTGSRNARGMAVKRRAEREWEETHGVRTAMNFLTRDISLAFHIKKPAQGSFFTPDRSRWFKTYFKGRSDQLHFTSLSNRKLYDNTHESEVCEIGYLLTAHSEKEGAGQYVLSRQKSPIIDEDEEKGGEPFALMEHVKEIQFKYYSQKKDRWSEEWDTEKRDFEDLFPDAVEVKLLVLQNQKEIPYVTKIMIANPNNEELQPPQQQGQGQGQQPGSQGQTP